MAVQRLDVAQNLPRLLELLGVEHLAAHHETDGAARVHDVAPDAAIQVFLAGDGAQHLARAGIGHVAGQHLGADFFQIVVNALQRVGGVFGVGVKQLEQHLARIFDQARRPACAQPQQAKHRNVLVVDGEQNALAAQARVDEVEDEGHPHRARVVVVVNQEVAADVQLAVVFFVKAGRFFDVLVHRIFGDGQAVVLRDPALFVDGGRFQIDPDGLEFGQLFQRLDFFLNESSMGKREDVEHGSLP